MKTSTQYMLGGAILALQIALWAGITGAWVTAIVSVFSVGRIPVLDFFCPPCGIVHGVLIWTGVASW